MGFEKGQGRYQQRGARGGSVQKKRKGKEWKGGEEDPKRGMREEDRGDEGAC